jgi:hypothetical protein
MIKALGNLVGALTKSSKSHAASFLGIPIMHSLIFWHITLYLWHKSL